MSPSCVLDPIPSDYYHADDWSMLYQQAPHDYYIQPSLWWEQCSEAIEYRALRALWRAMILQLVVDLCSGSSRTEDKQAKLDAGQWLRTQSADFHTIVQWTGWSRDYILEKITDAVKHQERWRRKKTSGNSRPKPMVAANENHEKPFALCRDAA